MNKVERQIEELNSEHLPYIKKVLKENAYHLLELKVADKNSDTKKATDFNIKVKGGDMACRVRFDTKKYVFRDFTIRTKVKNGGKTEIDKIKEGYADWYLYMWKRTDGQYNHVFIDLKKVRKLDILNKNRKERINKDPNGKPDGTAFISIPLKEIEPAIMDINFDIDKYLEYVKDLQGR